jgi:glycosyltransferase involved in cell wall biosynthesis
MITLILNSRKRVQQLSNLLESIRKTVWKIKNIKILIGVDDDDEDTIKFLQAYSGMIFDVQAIIQPRPSNLHVSINRLATKAKGDYIFILNDDVEFLTDFWDLELSKVNPNEIWYIGTLDNSADKERGGTYSSFPILTRAAYDALGYFMSEAFVGLGADVHLWRVFDAVGRTKTSSIELDHVFHRTVFHVQCPDQTALEMRQNSWRSNFNCWGIDISQDVERVKCLL